MITLYTRKTPNGRKLSIALEKLGLPCEVRPGDPSRRELHDPDVIAGRTAVRRGMEMPA